MTQSGICVHTIWRLKDPPLDLSFWSFLTFLHHGIEDIERHLLWKFYKKIRRKSWSNYYYYYYYSLLHHTSQKKAITKGEGEKPGVGVFVCAWVCACACVCACVCICLGTSICKVESTIIIVLRHFHELEWEYKEWIWLNTGSRLNRVREKLYQWVPIWHFL